MWSRTPTCAICGLAKANEPGYFPRLVVTSIQMIDATIQGMDMVCGSCLSQDAVIQLYQKLASQWAEENNKDFNWANVIELKFVFNPLSANVQGNAAQLNQQDEEDKLSIFLSRKCVIGQDKKVKSGEIYKVFVRWCNLSQLLPLSTTAFGKEMRKRFRTKESNGIYYLGVALISDEGHDDDIRNFIDERCVIGEKLSILSGNLYRAYEQWCNEKGISPKYHPRFSQSLGRMGDFHFEVMKEEDHTVRRIHGLSLK